MRGVNKLVMEIRPEDEYFERAILFLKPDKLSSPQKKISDGADKLLNDIYDKKYTDNSHKNLLFLSAGIAAGSLISWIIIYILASV